MRRREAVAGGLDLRSAGPRDLDADAAAEELHRRVGVVEERHRIVLLVTTDRDHRRELPRVALDRHVVRRGHQHAALEVRVVGDLVKDRGELLLRRRQAHVDQVEALLDGVAQAGEQHRARSGEAGAEDAHAVEVALRRNRANDAGAGRPMAARVALGVLLDDRVVVLVDQHCDRSLELTDERVPPLDPRVENADVHALSRRAAPRPLPRDALGPLVRESDVTFGVLGQAPRRKRAAARLRPLVDDYVIRHGTDATRNQSAG